MRKRNPYHFWPAIVGLLAAAVFIVALILLTNWHLYFVWIASFSLVTFAMFGIDKGLAKADTARIPEAVLHLFTLLGGFPGQFLGRIVFHHKANFRKHPSFTIVLIISIVIYGILGYFLFIG